MLGGAISLADCSLAPKLYHMDVATKEFFPDTHAKIKKDYPLVNRYMEVMFNLPEFKATVYPPETVIWGWTNARNAS